MAKNKEKKHEKVKHEDDSNKTTIFMTWFLLILMILSVIGFAVMSGIGSPGSDEDYTHQDVPLQQFTDPQTGTVFWGARINGEEFIFMSIEGFDSKDDLNNLAQEIKSYNSIDIYIADNFSSSDSIYLIEKSLRGLGIEYSRTNVSTCENPTLVLTYNETNFNENCMVFSPNKGEEAFDSEVLSYHLIR